MPKRIARALTRAGKKARERLKHTAGVISGKHLSKNQMRAAFDRFGNDSPYTYNASTGCYEEKRPKPGSKKKRWRPDGTLIESEKKSKGKQ